MPLGKIWRGIKKPFDWVGDKLLPDELTEPFDWVGKLLEELADLPGELGEGILDGLGGVLGDALSPVTDKLSDLLGGDPPALDPALKREGELSLGRAEARSWEDRIRRMEEGRDKALAQYRLADVFGGGAGTATPEVAYGAGTHAGFGRGMRGPLQSDDVPEGLDNISAWAKRRYNPFFEAREDEKEAYEAARKGLPDTGRPAYYGAIGDAHRAAATRDLDEKYGHAQRRTRFNVARRGLLGGSADVDAFHQLAKRHSDAARDVGSRARAAELTAAQGDEALRGRLAGLIDAGHSPGDVLRQARAGIGTSYRSAMQAANRAAVGDVFGGLGSALEQAPSFALLDSIRQGGNRQSRRRDDDEWWPRFGAGAGGGRVS